MVVEIFKKLMLPASYYSYFFKNFTICVYATFMMDFQPTECDEAEGILEFKSDCSIKTFRHQQWNNHKLNLFPLLQ